MWREPLDPLARAMLADEILGHYTVSPVQWYDPEYQPPTGRLIAVRTARGIFLHPMTDKTGREVPWHEQEERWTDGAFGYEEVLAWVRLA